MTATTEQASSDRNPTSADKPETNKDPKVSDAVTPLRYLIAVARPHALSLLTAFLLLFLAGAAWMFLPIGVSKVIDEALASGDRTALATWGSIVALCAGANVGMFILAYRLLFKAESRVRRWTVERLVEHLTRLGDKARNKVSPGDLVSLSTLDTQLTANFVFQLGFAWRSLCMFVIGMVLLWGISPSVAITVGLGALAIGTFTAPILGKFGMHQGDYRQQLADLSSQSSDLVNGLRILQGVGGEYQFSRRYREDSARLRSVGYQVANSDSWMQAVSGGLPIVLVAVSIWMGSRMAVAGTISVGELGAIFMLTVLIAGNAGFIIDSSQTYVVARVSARRLLDFFHLEADYGPEGGHRKIKGELSDPESGFTAPEGNLTVVVSDQRKPTVSLCQRLSGLEPSEARIGSVAIKDCDWTDFRGHALLLHDDYLFPQSLGETLRVGDDQVQAALDVVCGQDIYSSLGADSRAQIVERGRNLSGGQRQRLCLARALSAEPSVLLAVDPTSAVDAHTESLISERVAKKRDGLTTVVVTHSPIWLSHADQVVWLREGKVHAAGSHEDLAQYEEYVALVHPVRSQSSEREA